MNTTHTRLFIVMAAVALLGLALIARLVYLQVIDSDFLKTQGEKRTVRYETVDAHRGIIRDSQGRPLAISTPLLSVYADPSKVDLAHPGLAVLSDQLGVDALSKLRRAEGRKFMYVKRHLRPDIAQRVLDLGIPGIDARREYRRFYPAGEVTSHLVGFTDIDDAGQEGLEMLFDERLSGTPGVRREVRNRHGALIRDAVPVKEVAPGKDLTLSIDLRLQYLAYRELKSAVTLFRAASGSIVILDARTGQVRAMVNQPSYNPNNRAGLNMAAVRNRAVTDTFEPGSTVKPLTAAVALQSGRYAAASQIDTTPGFVAVGEYTIRDPRNRGPLTLSEIIAVSSQVGISKLALDLNEYEVRDMFDELGLGHATGVEFPGESAGFLPDHRRWSDIERVALAYGYGLRVTPLQLASAYLTIAADGMAREVSLLEDTILPPTRVFPAEVAVELRAMLESVVTQGTGAKAAVDGYRVAGKTGTVRKMEGGDYLDTEHVAFFAGMAPATRPSLVAVVLINEPRVWEYGGGEIAAPVFSRVMAGALRILNVMPETGDSV